jgi:hypothetical protein
MTIVRPAAGGWVVDQPTTTESVAMLGTRNET